MFKKLFAAETMETTIKKMSILGSSVCVCVFVLVERGVCVVLVWRGGVCVLFCWGVALCVFWSWEAWCVCVLGAWCVCSSWEAWCVCVGGRGVCVLIGERGVCVVKVVLWGFARVKSSQNLRPLIITLFFFSLFFLFFVFFPFFFVFSFFFFFVFFSFFFLFSNFSCLFKKFFSFCFCFVGEEKSLSHIGCGPPALFSVSPPFLVRACLSPL